MSEKQKCDECNEEVGYNYYIYFGAKLCGQCHDNLTPDDDEPGGANDW